MEGYVTIKKFRIIKSRTTHKNKENDDQNHFIILK